MSSLRLKTLRDNVNWKIKAEVLEFFQKVCLLVQFWEGELPNLQDIFRKDEIDLLLFGGVSWSTNGECLLVDFVFRTGYKDKPKVDEDGKPVLHCPTALHGVLAHDFSGSMNNISQLFEIYNNFEVNYIDETGLSHFHVACIIGCEDVVNKFLDLGQDPNIIWPVAGHSPLHLALIYKHERVTELLLRRGANPNVPDKMGCTPIHYVCREDTFDRLGETFFKVNDEVNQTWQLDVKDSRGDTPLHLALMTHNYIAIEYLVRRGANVNLANANGWTALQLPVAHLMPHVVDLLVYNGADLSCFVFPTKSQFQKCFTIYFDAYFELRAASGTLAVVDSLEKGEYELDRSDALTIMSIFAKHGFFKKFANLENNCWYDEEFATKAKKVMVKRSLSLYDLIQLPPKKAAKLLTYFEYFEMAHSIKWMGPHSKACALHLCEKMSRRFFREWALECFSELIHGRLPVICCEMIIDKLNNQDLYNICLAATGQNL